MSILAPSSSCQNPGEEDEHTGQKVLIGSCVVCWSVVGLAVIAGLVSKMLGLI